MKTIQLTQGKVALVDDEDYENLRGFRWCAFFNRNTHYAARRANGKTLLMHREILGAKRGELVDHRDGNGLNNCRENLRRCTNAQNLLNRRRHKNNACGVKGVRWCNRDKKWLAQIYFKKKRYYLGRFPTLQEAAHAYNEAARKYHGEYARLN